MSDLISDPPANNPLPTHATNSGGTVSNSSAPSVSSCVKGNFGDLTPPSSSAEPAPPTDSLALAWRKRATQSEMEMEELMSSLKKLTADELKPRKYADLNPEERAAIDDACPTRSRGSASGVVQMSEKSSLSPVQEEATPTDETQIAETLFAARYAEGNAEDAATEALFRACGLNYDDVDTWPLSDVTFDPYDASFEFVGVHDGWAPTAEHLAACWSLGFMRCWIRYANSTERYAATDWPLSDPKPSGEHRTTSDSYRLAREKKLAEQLAGSISERETLTAQLEKTRGDYATSLRLANETTEAAIAERDTFRDWFQNAEQARAVAEAKLASRSVTRCQKCGAEALPSPTHALDLEAERDDARAEVERLTREKAQLATQLEAAKQLGEAPTNG